MESPKRTFEAIGVVRSPFKEKRDAPRQARAKGARGVEGTIELFAGKGYEHAVEDLAGWSRIWVIFVFDRVEGWRPKVLPPRSEGKRRGVFATRSPHRPNPIGMSAVELVKVDGLVLHVRDLDILDETPVLDVKPYVAYADAFPEAKAGWLEDVADPTPEWGVVWSERAIAQVKWLDARGIELRAQVNEVLALGPQPNAYRRIRATDDGPVLAIKEWRARFRVEVKLRAIEVTAITTGYRPRDLAEGGPEIDVHRAFVAEFPRPA